MADPEQVERLKRSIEEWNDWRRDYPKIQPDLNDANLNGAYLSRANLSNANLNRAHLNGANLWNASLTSATLSLADLRNAYLNDAYLSGANLRNAYLDGANFNQATFLYTLFAYVDLSNVKDLEKAIYLGPSSVDVNSVILPHDEPTRLHFLRGVGFSDPLIKYLSSSSTPQYASCFISYANSDKAFARRLYQDLQDNGVRCWMATHDLRPGTPWARGIEEAIHLHEKLLLILSKDALTSNGVQQEVETALYKQHLTGQEILFPIRLDNMVIESDTLWAKRLRQRHIGDFTGWQDEAAYQQAFTTLLQHLKVPKP